MEALVHNVDDLLLNDLEKHYIEFFGTHAPTGHGYNLTKGGDSTSGYRLTDEQRDKMSARMKGHLVSEETKAKLSAANKGKRPSPECIAKGTAASKNRRMSEEARAKQSVRMKGNTHLRGHKPSEETRAKMSASQRGTSRSTRGKPWSLARRAAHKTKAENRDGFNIYSRVKFDKAV